MTANPSLPPIASPTALIASCAPLLGFEPRDCVVGFVSGVPGRHSPVVVRLDLGAGPEFAGPADALATGIAGTGGTTVDLVAWLEAPDTEVRAYLRSEAFYDEVYPRLAQHGVDVTISLTTNGRVWWSHDCPDPVCCGTPRPLDEAVLTQLRAEYVYAGYAPLADRETLVRRLAHDEHRAAGVAAGLDRARRPRDRQRWRELQIGFLSALLVPDWPARGAAAKAGATVRDGGPPLDAAAALRLLRGLHDVPTRDVVLHRMVRADPEPGPRWAASIAILEDVVRCAPGGTVAPVATVLAILVWLQGNGALANIALDRADADDPDYRLAELTRQLMARGVDPDSWRRTMATLTEAQCRGGSDAQRR